MSRTGKKRSTLELGHDAFLDIVANLVGILIILVVVLGSQSTAVIEEIKEQAIEESMVSETYASDQQLGELAQHSMRAAAAQADSNRLEKMVVRYDAILDKRKQQRAVLMDLLAKAKELWEDKKQDLDQRATELARLNSEYDEASDQLARLEGEATRLEDEPPKTVAVTHLPTPMARTVFGDELHFRLKGNRLSIVPIDKLYDEIKKDFSRASAGSREGILDSAVGPVRGYVARYEVAKDRQMVSQGGRIGMATRLRLMAVKFEPLKEPHGQPIEKVIAETSQLDIELAGRDPGSTTITVWVYPDSFASFRQLKEHLYAKGFATAARPLPMHLSITTSPQGTRSRAQ